MKHSVESHTVSCGCRSVGECGHSTFAWMTALDALVDEFAEAMKKKLRKKFMEGKSGWDDPEWAEHEIQDEMIEHCGITITATGVLQAGHEMIDPVDVANFAAFLWNRRD